MPTKFAKIFFDLDGTLSDSYPGIENGIRFALTKAGIEEPPETDIKKIIGIPLYESFNRYYFNDTAKTLEAVASFREYYHDKGLYESALYSGIIELLYELSTISKLYVITAKPTLYAQKLLAYHNVANLFTEIVGCQLQSINFSKANLIKDIHNGSYSVMVGDKKEDIDAGKETGIKTCGVLYGYGTHQEIQDSEPDFIIDSVHQLKEVLI